MAIGNAIVTTAKFKPLSYQEWAAPLQALNTQHAATEEALWELQDKAAEYELRKTKRRQLASNRWLMQLACMSMLPPALLMAPNLAWAQR